MDSIWIGFSDDENNYNGNKDKNDDAADDDDDGRIMPPILLLMDSAISAFDATDKMYESMSTGLSGKNEFLRQLKRLQLSHDIILVATRTVWGSSFSYSSSSSSSISTPLSNCDGWNKMVTSRITLEKALRGSKEEENGYSFVAIMTLQRSVSGTASNGNGNATNIMMEWNNVIPFSITETDGIKC